MIMDSIALPMPSQAELEGKGTYAYAIDHFNAWCIENDHQPFPAFYNSISQWLNDNSASWGGNTQYAYSAAIIYAHKCAGSPPRGDRGTLKALLRSVKPRHNHLRKAKPFLSSDLDDVLAMLRPQIPVDARDGALFAIAWGASISRSNVVGLDWEAIEDGKGSARIGDRGVHITLRRNRRAALSEIVIADNQCRPARRWLEAWVSHLELQPGQHIFRPVNKRGAIGMTRLTGESANKVIKKRISELAQTRGYDKEASDEFAASFSSHSLRNPLAPADTPTINEQLNGERPLTKGVEVEPVDA